MTIVGVEPGRSGYVERSGQRIAWQEFGSGDDVVLLLPTWSIVHSDHWRHQVPHLMKDFPDFLHFFCSQCFTEPDSEKEIEHFFQMGLQTTPEALLATAGTPEADLDADRARAYATALECSTLVIHGDGDAITPLARGRELAALTGGRLVVMPGSGHEPHCRDPQPTNQIIDGFLAEVTTA